MELPNRCALCGRDEEVKESQWVEPKSSTDSSPMYRRAWICEDCHIVHWAQNVTNN